MVSCTDTCFRDSSDGGGAICRVHIFNCFVSLVFRRRWYTQVLVLYQFWMFVVTMTAAETVATACFIYQF